MPSYGNGFEALAHMNLFRVLADLTHAFSKIILIFAIHRNRSAEGMLPPSEVAVPALLGAAVL